MKISEDRHVERLAGKNRGIAQMLTNKVHVSLSGLQAVRVILASMRTPLRDLPVGLRRGLVLCILEQHFSNQRTYENVAGKPINSQRVLGFNGVGGIEYANVVKNVARDYQ